VLPFRLPNTCYCCPWLKDSMSVDISLRARVDNQTEIQPLILAASSASRRSSTSVASKHVSALVRRRSLRRVSDTDMAPPIYRLVRLHSFPYQPLLHLYGVAFGNGHVRLSARVILAAREKPKSMPQRCHFVLSSIKHALLFPRYRPWIAT
jgi:hypothetical protein